VTAKGCLVPLLAVLGFLLLFPGLCFLAVGRLAGPSNPGAIITIVAVVLLAAAFAVARLIKGD
jgi:hypothetical protein